MATVYVVVEDGREVRPIGDSAGAPVELAAGTESAVVQRASDYLETRLGPRVPVPETTQAPGTGRHEGQQPFDRWWVPALDPIHQGQGVVFSGRGAKGLTQTTGIPPEMKHFGAALENIGVGHRGWIREHLKKA